MSQRPTPADAAGASTRSAAAAAKARRTSTSPRRVRSRRAPPASRCAARTHRQHKPCTDSRPSEDRTGRNGPGENESGRGTIDLRTGADGAPRRQRGVLRLERPPRCYRWADCPRRERRRDLNDWSREQHCHELGSATGMGLGRTGTHPPSVSGRLYRAPLGEACYLLDWSTVPPTTFQPGSRFKPESR